MDIFFVISGFLISTILLNNLKWNKFSFVEFYCRRIRRIFPALIVVLIACFAFGWYALLPDEYRQLCKHIAGGAGFVSNLVLWNESGYFDNIAETKPLLHLWSLGIEEQFYIVWPLVLWFAWKQKFNTLAILLVAAVVSFALNIVYLYGDTVQTFYSPLTRFWEFQIGSVLAYTLNKDGVIDTWKTKIGTLIPDPYAQVFISKGYVLRNCQSVIGVGLLLAGVILISRETYFPGWWAVLPTIGAMLIILAGEQSWVNRVVLSNQALVWVGLISYPMYLWHWPILSFARIVESEVPSTGIRVTAVGVTIILAWFTFKLIESPIRSGRHGSEKTIALVFLMLVIGLAGYVGYRQEGLKFRESIKLANAVNGEFVGPLWKYTKNDTCMKGYQFEEAKKYDWWFCMASSDEKPTLLLLGNSYANQLFPGLAKNAALQQHSILSIGACGPEWIDESRSITGESRSPCSGDHPLHQQKFISGIIEKTGSVRFAIINGLPAAPDNSYLLALKKKIDFLEKEHVKVIVFKPSLTINYDIKGCFARPLMQPKKNCEVSLGRYREFSDKFKPVASALSLTNPGVVFFDQNELFCNSEKCSMIRNGMPLFRDQYNHLSEYGSIELANIFVRWAKNNVPELLQ